MARPKTPKLCFVIAQRYHGWHSKFKVKIKPSLNMHKVFIAVGANETLELDSPQHDMVDGAKKLKSKILGSNSPNTEVKLLTIQDANHETAFPTTAIQGLYWLFND